MNENENEEVEIINTLETIIGFLTTSITLIVLSFVFAAPITWLWNWIIPHLFGLPHITFLESFGLTLLVSLLTVR